MGERERGGERGVNLIFRLLLGILIKFFFCIYRISYFFVWYKYYNFVGFSFFVCVCSVCNGIFWLRINRIGVVIY